MAAARQVYDDAQKAAGKNACSYIYPNTQNDFHNNTASGYGKAVV